MATTKVKISRDNAVLLLAAAKALDLDASVVQTTTEGVFIVPREVAEKADLAEKKAPAAKTAVAKKAPAKKAAAKKAAAKGQE